MLPVPKIDEYSHMKYTDRKKIMLALISEIRVKQKQTSPLATEGLPGRQTVSGSGGCCFAAELPASHRLCSSPAERQWHPRSCSMTTGTWSYGHRRASGFNLHHLWHFQPFLWPICCQNSETSCFSETGCHNCFYNLPFIASVCSG